MKNIAPKLVELFKSGYCTPQIARIAKILKEPSTTIHYNIKKLEKEGKIKSYAAVFDYKKLDMGHCTYILATINQDKYGEPEEIADALSKDSRIESIDIVTGDYELIIKLRSKDIDDYYAFVKVATKKYGFAKVVSLTSLKQVKSQYVKM
jgi:DNA-binding Lrp family transcriptional regulator|tara:strand:+ start:992 stop:1441 length:450 start_codon:yes stop_codon:yes gene_type:complete